METNVRVPNTQDSHRSWFLNPQDLQQNLSLGINRMDNAQPCFTHGNIVGNRSCDECKKSACLIVRHILSPFCDWSSKIVSNPKNVKYTTSCQTHAFFDNMWAHFGQFSNETSDDDFWDNADSNAPLSWANDVTLVNGAQQSRVLKHENNVRLWRVMCVRWSVLSSLTVACTTFADVCTRNVSNKINECARILQSDWRLTEAVLIVAFPAIHVMLLVLAILENTKMKMMPAI